VIFGTEERCNLLNGIQVAVNRAPVNVALFGQFVQRQTPPGFQETNN
jgi:hypothetical protein